MNKKLKLLIVANNCPWETWPRKIKALKDWFAPKCDFEVDIMHTKFTDIPFTKYKSFDAVQDGFNIKGIDPSWYDRFISPLGMGYHIVLFALARDQWPFDNDARGWRNDSTFGAVELQVAADENELYFFGGEPEKDMFTNLARHEIMHALYTMIYGPLVSNCAGGTPAEHKAKHCDPTHQYWNEGHLDKALMEIEWPEANLADKLTAIQYIIGLITQAVNIIIKMPKQYPLIEKMLLAMQEMEGYYPPNSHFPDGSRSWRNCNPLNLKYAGQVGSMGQDKNGFAVFPDYETGLQAGRNQLLIACKGKSRVYSPKDTLLAFCGKFAPSNDGNNPQRYAEFIGAKLGLPITTRLEQLLV